MSYFEYTDMFDACQDSGKYHMFIVDIKNSKDLDIRDSLGLRTAIMNKIVDVVCTLKRDDMLHVNTHPLYNRDGYFIFGDLFGFVVKSGCEQRTRKIMQSKFTTLASQLHFADGKYETDDWAQGAKEYYFGYCIQELEKRAKKKKEL